jgi:hypothetical protein
MKIGASNLGAQSTAAPATAVTITLIISPCRWKRGITFSASELRLSCSVEATQSAPTQSCPWLSGTSFGRRVVPLVCIASATARRRTAVLAVSSGAAEKRAGAHAGESSGDAAAAANLVELSLV